MQSRFKYIAQNVQVENLMRKIEPTLPQSSHQRHVTSERHKSRSHRTTCLKSPLVEQHDLCRLVQDP
jgi:hypothetical protein